MPPHAVVLHAAAVVLAVTGVGKLVDPRPAARAMGEAGLGGGIVAARLLGTAEVVTAAGVLTAGGRLAAVALAVVYLGFLAFIVANRARGLDVPCGCIGPSERPPGVAHLVIDTVAVVVGAAAIARPVSDVGGWTDEGPLGVVALMGVVVLAAAAIAAIAPARLEPR